MSYLKLIDDKIQSLSESLSSVLNIDITVVDDNLLRIAGTGCFYNRINENSPENSLFSKVLQNGTPELNEFDTTNSICLSCSYADACKESKSMIFPIKVDQEIIGVVCFASFTPEQDQLMVNNKDKYMDMIKHLADNIEKEILSIKMVNKLNMGIAEINGIINSINRGILIINADQKIIYINSKAIRSLNINFSVNKIINKKIENIITNIKIDETNNKELIGNWIVGGKNIKVLYKVNYIVLDNNNISTLINFDTIDEIVNIAMTYNDDNIINFENIIGCSQAMKEVIQKAKIAAKSDSTIYLCGPSGTGKELFARSIHNASFRKDGPFVAINCATLPENLIESELFGYEKGAFTGASAKGKIGKFEQANNGTLFLDEIADLPLHLQSKLLRVLQEKKIDKIGGTASTDVNIRVISASHTSLEDMIERNEFREDLFYRLNVIPIHLPPLKDRDEDVLLCGEFIIKKLCQKMNKSQKSLSKDLESVFLTYSWPGNVRELENVLEYAMNFSMNDEIIKEDLPEYFFKNISKMVKVEEETADVVPLDINDYKNLDEMTKVFEKKVLKNLLNQYGDTAEGKKEIAKKLGMSVTTLYRKINDYYQ